MEANLNVNGLMDNSASNTRIFCQNRDYGTENLQFQDPRAGSVFFSSDD